MKILNKVLSLIIIFTMIMTSIPIYTFADSPEKEYSISNGYLTYTINNKTGGFSIVTDEGHPQKKYDNNIPLLYKEDKTRSNGTSFITVRIDGKDYIFGQSYGMFGISSLLHEPIVSEEGRLLTVQWDIKGYSIIQKVALSIDEKSDITGNVGISYQIINNNSSSGMVGIRLLLDTALDNNVDSPYVLTDTMTNPQLTEKEYKDSELPQQIRLVDSLSSPKKMAYLLLKGWNEGVVPDKAIVGHWANLANTRYSYTADSFCDFSNYSNKYRTPDSSIALYWSESTLAAGATRTAELLYGIGNFSSDLSSDRLGIDIVTNKVKLTLDKKNYLNDGEFEVTINLDNSLNNAQDLINPVLVLTADSGLTVIGEYYKSWSEIKIGETKTVRFKLKADKQTSITSKMIYASLSAIVVEGDTQKTIETSSSRHILLPAVTGNLPKIQMNSANPKIVYTQGDKSVTVSGKMDEFSSLKGSVNWDMYLVHASSNHEVLIKKSDIAFIDDTYTAFSFKTREELSVGAYKIVFRLRDNQLKEGFGTDEITANCLLNVSADEKYKQTSYGILALVRHENSNYKYITFATESDYKKFYKGQSRVDGIQHDFSQENSRQNEILLIIRGRIIQMEKEEAGKKKIYYQTSSNDGPITINNMLTYESDSPLTIQDDGSTFSVSGDGKLNVINSITVWKYKWNFSVSTAKPYTLNLERYKKYSSDTPEELKLNLDGAGMILQSIAGFLVNIKYGVMSSELQNDDEKSTTYGIGFGGSISIPIKSEDKDKENKKEEGEFSKGQLAVDIEEILYGEKAKINEGKLEVEDTGFIGIDANLNIVLPEDVLGKFIKNAPGIRASLTINTIKNEYELDLGVKVKVLECQGILAFKQVVVKNSEKIVPDKIEFYIHKGIKVPIAPPSLFMTAIGGGINDLAATIGGDTISGLPPLTILAYTRLELMKNMIGDFNAAINLQGMDLNGTMSYKGKKGVVDLDGQISAGWTEPWYVNVYGRISIIDGLMKGGVTIKIAEDYFYGYIYAKICIPDSVPIIGGKEINGVEAAVTNTYIGANIKIIGIKFGVIYYWDGSYDFGSGIDISEKSFMRSSTIAIEDELSAGNYEFMYGTNIHPLDSKEVKPRFSLLGSNKTFTINFDPSGNDSLLFTIPYNGYAIPKPEDITISSPMGNIALIEDDGKGGGNFLVQDRGYDGKYIYVTVTNKDYIVGGNWTLTVNNDAIDIEDFSVSGVDYLPELTDTSFTYNNENPYSLNINWTADKEYDENTIVDVYLTKDKNTLEKIKTSSNNSDETLGISVANIEINKYESGSSTISLPDTLESGKYYLVTAMTSKSCGISLAISNNSFDFVNTNLPKPVKSVNLNYAGNGSLLVEVEDQSTEDIDYTDYLVNIFAADDASLDNAFAQFELGDDIIIGKDSNLVPGQSYYAEVRTLRYDNDKHYYSTDIVRSNAFIMPELNKPRLLSVTTNADSDYLNDSKLTVTYKFDRAVWMLLNKNSEYLIKDEEYKDTWTFDEDLVDGSYLIDFITYSSTKDSVTGADFSIDIANAQLGFIVDTQAPVLSLGQRSAKSLEKDGIDYVTSAFGTNVVFADSTGKYTVSGISEINATLLVNGTKAIVIQKDGSFTYTGSCNDKEPYTELLFEAIDKAGNRTSMLVNVINQKYVYIDSIKVMVNGTPLSYDSEGVLTLNIKSGDTASLSLLGKTSDSEIAIDNSNVQWHIMYEKGLIDFDEGNITALYTGQSAIRVKYITAQLADGTEIGPEEYFVINIIENDKSDLKLAIDAAIANLNSATNASESLKESYRQAISIAQQVYDDSDASESEISQATAALKLATRLFDEERSKGGSTIINKAIYYTLRATPCENGRIELSSTIAKKGTSVTITAIPDKGFRVYDLVINGVSYGNKNIITIPSINDNLVVSAVFREIWDCPFVDINENDWFYNEVEDAYKANLFKGTSEKTFGPYNPMTRAMLVTVLGRMSGISPDYSINSSFDDVAQGSWYTGFVEWAKDNGIINGATNTSFAPNSNISREQVAVILYRYAGFIGLDTSTTKDNNLTSYKDLNDVSDYAISAMQWAVEKGIITGRSQSLKPKENASRAEIAVILMRFMKLK